MSGLIYAVYFTYYYTLCYLVLVLGEQQKARLSLLAFALHDLTDPKDPRIFERSIVSYEHIVYSYRFCYLQPSSFCMNKKKRNEK